MSRFLAAVPFLLLASVCWGQSWSNVCQAFLYRAADVRVAFQNCTTDSPDKDVVDTNEDANFISNYGLRGHDYMALNSLNEELDANILNVTVLDEPMNSPEEWFKNVIAHLPPGAKHYRDNWNENDPDDSPAMFVSYEKDGAMYVMYMFLNHGAKDTIYPDREMIIAGIRYNLQGHHQTRDDETAQAQMRWLMNRLLNSLTWDSSGLR